MKKTLKITDLDFSFRSHPVTGNLVLKSGPDVIKQSLKTLLLLNIFEKPFSIISGNITNKLFETYDYVLESQIKNDIYSLIKFYEPRVETSLENIVIDSYDPNTLNITIIYTIIGEDVPQQELSVEVSRTR